LLLALVRSIAFVIVSALIIVPTIMRSRQHVDLRDSTRLSIRLNWQSDTPPQKSLVTPDDASAPAAATVDVVQQPQAARVRPRVHLYAEPIVRPPLDHAPDQFRGPPSSRA
jgi:hypothetical protein